MAGRVERVGDPEDVALLVEVDGEKVR